MRSIEAIEEELTMTEQRFNAAPAGEKGTLARAVWLLKQEQAQAKRRGGSALSGRPRKEEVSELPKDQEFFTAEEIAELLRVTKMTVYRLLNAGAIPYHQVGKAKRIAKADLDAYLAKTRRGGKNAGTGE